MRLDRTAAALFGLIALAACEPEEVENIQTRADNVANMLENRADEIAAEAEKGVDEQVGILDNQTAILANQAKALLDGDGNEAQPQGNKQ
jgi:hypothetical protein